MGERGGGGVDRLGKGVLVYRHALVIGVSRSLDRKLMG